MRHTPGPWFQSHRAIPNDKDGIYSTQVYDEKGETIADLAWYPVNLGNGHIGTAREANARLIAAAPDLLAASKHAAMEWRLHGQLTDSCRVLEAAIAKAEGGKP